ncbi:ankyrin [Bimuria novae-zelandiae CBS 107.79]|uniref:Ankyrin n=1 Tax=Bimuria novae-zelandiae CBS 107.79 TaxID=1447943 RepID=A0A6A5VKI6_9PLEO|nr:ankyrin [Bimuria novae-zelandiae CBS 107.79]
MKARQDLQDLIREAGVQPVSVRQPSLPAPTQPASIASQEDDTLARQLLVEQRINGEDYRDPAKQLKRIFRSSKEKEKLQDTNQWEFSQDELDRALSAVIDKPATSVGLVQAFLNLGAKVNFIEAAEKKSKANKNAVPDRRRSTVLQRAATIRRPDSLSLLAASGADQTTLNEGLKAALAANNQAGVQELLRHGADLNACPNALADAVRSNDQNFIRLLLRAPKALRPEIISSCLPAAVQQKSEPTTSLLIGHGADPNFNNASAFVTSISQREYRLAVALTAGPIPLSVTSLQVGFETAMQISNSQDLYRFLQLLLCCGMTPNNRSLGALLIATCKRNDVDMAEMLISHGVPTDLNEAECLRKAISKSNWKLVDAILSTSISPVHASMALDVVPFDAPKSDRLHVIEALASKGADGRSLERWLVRAVEDGDSALTDFLINAGAPLAQGNNRAIQAAVARKDTRSLRSLLASRPPPQSLAQVFPLIRSGYTAPERLATVRLLLEHGARGPEVDQALVDAVADTSGSRDVGLITELVRHGAHVDYDNGQVFKLAVSQADVATLRLLCGANPSTRRKSSAIPLIFDTNGSRHSSTVALLELLLAGGVEEGPARQALDIAIKGGSNNLDIVERLIAANARLIGVAFDCAISLDNVRHKEAVLKLLLSKGIPQDTLDQALEAESRQLGKTSDTTIVQLLLVNGASINYNGGHAFVNSTATGNASFVKLLLSGREEPSRAAVSTAFRSLFDVENLRRLCTSKSSPISTSQDNPSSSALVEIADDLLSRGIEQNVIDMALRAVLDPASGLDEVDTIVERLLSYHADANAANGVCFVFAARRSPRLFTKLLTHCPSYRVILPSLIDCGFDEETLLDSIEACFGHGCTADDLDLSHPPSLVLAIQKYPRSESLINKLLSHGCNPDASSPGVVDSTTGEESIHAVLCALAQPQKLVSSAVIIALLRAGASSTRVAPVSEITPIALAAREGRSDIVKALLEHDADASIRDKWNRSALFYASSSSATSVVEALAPHALKNDGSLHEAARNLQLDGAAVLIKFGHDPNFPSRLHEGRNALGEFCLNAELSTSTQLSRARRLLRFLLDNGARPNFKARNERSAVILALDNPHDPLKMTDTLLETEVWEQLNDESHMFCDAKGLWYSPISYVEHVPSPARAAQKQDLLDLFRDKGCSPKYYSSTEDQPPSAIGLPPSIARLVARQKEHRLSLRLAKEASDHARMLEETSHIDALRRQQENQDAALAAAAASAAHSQTLEQRQHDAAMHRVREAERMKRAEKVAWHALLTAQEHESAAQRAQIEERRAAAAVVAESRMVEVRKGEVEHRAGVERRALKEKEEHMGRNVKMQMQIQDRVDESARVHAGLRGGKQIEWGTVD